jgi:hypothetical protein
MGDWNNFDGGRRANANTQRLIDAQFAHQRRQRGHYAAIVAVIIALCILFAFFDVRIP